MLTNRELRSEPLHVEVDSMPAGAASLTDAELRASPVPIAVEGVPHVVVDSMPAGGSGLTDSELRATPVEVDVTFPSIQPVSDNGGSITVDGAVSVSNFPSTQAVSGTVAVSNFPATQPVSGTVAVSGTVPVQTKFTNRVRRVLKFHGTAPATADTLLTLTSNLAGVESSGTSQGVTSGKVFRITSIKVSVKANAAAAAWVTASIRSLHNGPTLIGSPILFRLDTGLTAAAAGATAQPTILDLDEGYELSGAETIGVSLAAQATTNIVSIELIGFEYTP